MTWIDDGEKYALVGLRVKTEERIPHGKITPNLWVLANPTFAIPANWKEWLGSIRADEVEGCNLFILSKIASQTSDVLDGENEVLKQQVWNFYVGLLLASRFTPAHRPVLLTGARRDGYIDVRQQQDIDSPAPRVFRPYPPITSVDMHQAAQLAEGLRALTGATLNGGHWRLFRTLHVYTEARTNSQLIDRIHQFSRSIDGLILPDIGKTRKQFRSRTELFIGPRHHDLMGEIYDVRSDVEHLHEYRYLETFDRMLRLDLVKKEAIIEHIASTALARIIKNSSFWPHFGNTAGTARFWALPPADRQKIWGAPIDPLVAVADFDPQYLHDGHLGG